MPAENHSCEPVRSSIESQTLLPFGRRREPVKNDCIFQNFCLTFQVKVEQTRCESTKNIHNKYDIVITSAVEEAASFVNDKGFLFAICPKKRSQPVPVHLESVTKYSLNLEDFILFKKASLKKEGIIAS